MNENINLCKILKGHEGETFYSPAFGDVKLEDVNCPNVRTNPIRTRETTGMAAYFSKEGKFNITENSECVLFPSKNQRDWDKWAEEQRIKTPKTWSELVKADLVKFEMVATSAINNTELKDDISQYTPIEKSALALLKIHQLIEVGYGGVPTTEYRINLTNPIYVIDYFNGRKEWFVIAAYNNTINHIAFYTKEQAEKFLSYPENIQLLREFYML